MYYASLVNLWQSVEMAQLFRMRSSSVLAESALKKWRAVFQSHQNAQAFAVHYHRAQLQYKMLLTWLLDSLSSLFSACGFRASYGHGL